MKKTLLMAAATLAAGIISTQATGVYSQNIVGYVNVAAPIANNSYALSVPFTIGVTNGANEVFGTNLPNYTQVLLWNASAGNYVTYQTDNTSGTGWDDGGFNPVNAPLLPVGQGFFLIPSGGVTNTFAGVVAINVGTTNALTFPTANASYFVGEVVPYGGAATNSSVNLNGLANYTQVLIWDPSAANFVTYQTDNTSETGWDDGGFNPIAPPIITPGLGFYLIPSANSEVWTQSL
jgi:hypothetical protein